MTAVLGGDRDEVLAALDEHGLTAANDNGPGQIVAAGTLEQLAALADDAAGEGPADPAERRRRLPHRAHGSPRSGTSPAWPARCRPTTRAPAVISNRDGQVVHDGREVLARIVGQIASPVRWDLCMETMLDLGVTGILEMPPAGTLTGIAKRAHEGRRDLRAQDPRPARRRPRLRRQARRAPPPIDTTPTWRMLVSPAKGTFHRVRRGRPSADASPPGAPIGAVASLRDETAVTAPHGGTGRRVARRGRRPGLPRPAAGPPAPRGGAADDRHPQHRHRRAARRDPRHRRLPARRGSSPTPRSSRRIDSSDEWIQQRSGIKQRRWAEPRGDRPDDVASPRRARRSSAPASTPAQIDCVDRRDRLATCSRPRPSPPPIAHELGTDQAAAFDISAACAGFCHGVALASDMVRGGSAKHVLVIGVERLTDITDLDDRGTAFIFADGAGAAVVGPSDDPGHRPGRLGLRRRAVRPDPADARTGATSIATRRARQMPHLVMQGNPVFRWASFEMAKIGQQALDRAGITVDDLDVFVPAPGQHAHHRRDGPLDEAARARRGSPATSPTRATPRPPRSRSPSTG